VFLDADDRKGFLGLLRKVNERCNWLCHAYCLHVVLNPVRARLVAYPSE